VWFLGGRGYSVCISLRVDSARIGPGLARFASIAAVVQKATGFVREPPQSIFGAGEPGTCPRFSLTFRSASTRSLKYLRLRLHSHG
jgi:hypothetical protein